MAHEKCTAFPAPIFTKFKNVQQRYGNVPYTYFHSNRKIIVENQDRKAFTPVKKHRFRYAQFKNSKDLIIFGHFLYQIFSNPRKNVGNTENFISVIFVVPIFFTNLLNAQRRYVDTSYAKFYINWK
jgi:hypothetical protein